MRIALSLLLAVLLLLAGGCETALERVDRQAFEEMKKRQQATLGEQSLQTLAVPPVSQDATPTEKSYQPTPGTVNPTSQELPAKRAAAVADPLASVPDMMTAEPTDPSAVHLDLSGALAYAVKNSRQYRNEQEELYLSALDLLVQQHLWGPRFFQTVSTQYTGNLQEADRDDAMRIVTEAGVRQRLPYGGQVAATALVQYVDLLRASGDEGQSGAVGLSVTLPLLRGAGRVAQEDLIQAQRDLVYAARGFERFRREFLLDVATRYYDLLRQQAEIENLKGQVENLEWLLRRIRALAEAGREPFFEVQRSEQQVLFARNNLLNAREAYALALDTFKLTLGMPMPQAVVITRSEVIIAEPELDVERAVASGLSYRLDLQTAQDQVEDARRRVAVAKNQTLPGLDVDARVNLETEPDQSVDLSEADSRYAASVTLDAPWDRQVENIRWRQALVNLERSQRSYTLQRDQVMREVRSSIRRIIQARSTLALQNRNIEIARTRLRGVLLRLRSLGPRDFIEAQEDLTEARNRRDLAVRNLRVSILQYLLDTGQMRVQPDGQWEPPAQLTVPAGEDPLAGPADLLTDPVPQQSPMIGPEIQAPAPSSDR